MKRKIYKLLSSAKKGLFALTVFSGTAYAQATYTLNYTGSVQTLNLQAGSYDIKMWGGDGYTETVGYNGKGGYSTGVLMLSSAQTIYIYVGGMGGYPASAVTANAWTFNGGGIGYPASNPSYGNGGGATDVRTVGGTWDNPTSLASRAIVAGGGGAGRNSSYVGAHAGGLTGATGTYYAPDQTGGPTGGTQTAGGSNTGYTAGLTLATLGKAMTWDGNAPTATWFAGGGGGYYGGATGRVAGAGGSSYIGGVSSGTTIMYGQTGFVSKPIVTGDGYVLVKELCNVGITTTSSLICTGTTVTLTTNASSNFNWSTGNTTSSVIVVSPTSSTTYTIGGTGTSPSGCAGSAAITITVNNTPTVTINSSTTSACLGQTVSLTATGANTYVWTGSTPTVTNGIAFSPAATTSYSVTGTNACGTSSAAVTVTVSVLPVLVSTSSTLVCASTPATLMAGGATTYTWMPGNSTQTNNIVSPAANTVYTVTGTTGNCQGTNTIAITTKPNPTITIVTTATAICDGDAASLTANGGLSYTWNPVTSSNMMITINPTVSTLYSVTGINNLNCTASANQVVIVRPKPTVNASASDPLVCVNGASTLTATGNATTYVWNGAAAGTSTVVSPGVTTTYTVVGTSSASCVNSATVTVSVLDLSLTVSSSTAVCRGTNVNLSASGTDEYHWSTGSAFSGISITPTTTTTYTVGGSTTQGLVTCSVSGAVTVSVNPNPTVSVSGSASVICKGESAVITATGATSYTFAGATPTVAASMTVTPTADQTFTVMGEDANGCKGTGSVLLRVASCVGINGIMANTVNLSVYPNPSTGDFTISSDEAISLQITNEIGQVVKTITLNKTVQTVNVSNLADGIYFITGQNANGSVNQKLIISK